MVVVFPRNFFLVFLIVYKDFSVRLIRLNHTE